MDENRLRMAGFFRRQTEQERTGTSQRTGSEWIKQTWLFEQDAQPADSVVMEIFDKKVQQWIAAHPGERAMIELRLTTREYNGRLYNDVSLGRLYHLGQDVTQQPQPQQAQQTQQPQPVPQYQQQYQKEDDYQPLPF
ncbi:MAG: DUF3127 domain-containing protein [Prevotellaceae bacterium]|nr:DUF3127 domain-containing protein [Prevotellaceae bacterium]